MSRSYDWDGPANLYIWPSVDGTEEDLRFPTLRAALTAATDHDRGTAWIVTQDGDILTPGLIAELRDDLAALRRKRSASALSIFGWASAA